MQSNWKNDINQKILDDYGIKTFYCLNWHVRLFYKEGWLSVWV